METYAEIPMPRRKNKSWRTKPATSLCWLIVFSTGISSGCGGSLGRFAWNPFHDYETTTYLTPPIRSQQLEQLAESARSKSPAEQQQVAEDLTRQIQAEQDPLMRERLLTAIAPLSPPLALTVLKAGLQDESSSVRARSVELIAKHKRSDAVTVLSQVVRNDTDLDVRLTATRELGQFNDRVAIDAIAPGLEDDDPAMRYRTMESLAKMTDEDLGLNVVAWKEYLRGGPTQNQPSLAEKVRKLGPF